jgi:hypothetical protein
LLTGGCYSEVFLALKSLGLDLGLSLMPSGSYSEVVFSKGLTVFVNKDCLNYRYSRCRLFVSQKTRGKAQTAWEIS